MVQDKHSMWAQALRARQIELHRSTLPMAIGGASTTAALLLAMQWSAVPAGPLLAWVVALLLAFGARIGTRIWHGRAAPGHAADRVWLARYRVGFFVHGLVWGAASMLPLAPGDAVHLSIMVVVLVGISVSGMSLAATDLTAGFLFGAPVLALLSLRLFTQSEPVYWLLGVTSTTTMLYMALTSRQAHRAVCQYERLRLAEATQARKLRSSEDLLERTGALAGVGGWELDLGTMALRLTAQSFRIHGAAPVARPTFDAFMSLYAPEQQALIRAGLADVIAHATPYDRELPLTTRSGETRWVRLIGRPEVRDGKVVHIDGVVQDVTESRAAQRALAEQHHLLALLVRTTSEGFWFIDPAGVSTDLNPAMCAILGCEREAVIGHSVLDFVDAANAAIFREQIRMRADGVGARYEIMLTRADGSQIQCLTNATPIFDSAGRHAGAVGMLTDITERKKDERALIAAKEEAERANRAKSQFLSSMSHELRTPMNAIIGFGQLLSSDPVNPLVDRQRDYVREILRGARHLLSLINEVLDLALVETGKLRLSMEPVGVRDLLRECVALMHPLGRERGIELTVIDESACDCFVLADRTRLKQVVLNLLSNAIKYNRHGGHAHIACTRGADAVRVAIADTGPGLGHDEATRLFQPFERLGAAQTPVEGAGLGLALSRELMDAMGGQIGLESEVGSGCTFWICLPRVEAPAEAAANEPTVAAPLADATRSALARKVLYIEDNPVNVLLMEAMLARVPGVVMISAPLPDIGLRMAVDERPDLILLDIQLPGMDGFEVLRRLRAEAASRGVPVIAVSANAMPGDLEQGIAAGFVQYLTKPLDMRQLHAAVDAALASV